MPAQVKKTTLVAKLGNRLDAAFSKHSADPIRVGGFQDLPPGIRNGRARLTEIGFYEFDKDSKAKKADGTPAVGEMYYRAVGVMLTPPFVVDQHGVKHKVEGMQTSVMISVMDTRNADGKLTTQHQHLGVADAPLEQARPCVLDEIRKLGVDTKKMAPISAAKMDAAVQALNKMAKDPAQGIVFTVNTSLGKTQLDPATGKPKADPKTGQPYPPRTFINWDGKVDEVLTESDDGVADETAVAESSGDAAANGEYTDQSDLDITGLVERAGGDGDDGEHARTKLKEMALEAGHSEEDVDNADDWDAVAALIASPKDQSEAPTPDEVPDPEPKKGNMFKTKLVDPKTKRKRSTDVEVLSVDKKNRTVTIKDLTTGKPVLGADKKPLPFSWDDLDTE